MITTDDRGKGGVQNRLKSDDVYVNDPLLYYTGEKKIFISSLCIIKVMLMKCCIYISRSRSETYPRCTDFSVC